MNTRDPSRRRGRTRAWTLAALACLLFQEAVFRLVFPLPDVKGFNRLAYMPVGEDNAALTAIRSIRVFQESAPDGVAVTRRLNEYGFRGGRWPARKAGGAARVFFVGDSFVESALVPDGETTPERFAAAASAGGLRVEALNLGVTGGGLESSVRLVVDAAPALRPDLVFLVLYANDLPDAVDLPQPRAFGTYPALMPRFGELLGMALRREQLPYRWSWRVASFDRSVPSPDNPWSDPAYEARYRGLVSPRILAAMRAGRFNAYRVKGSLYVEDDLRAPFDIRDLLAGLREYLEKLGSRLAVVYIPERGTLTNNYLTFERELRLGLPTNISMTGPAYQLHRRLLREQCAEKDVPFFDCTDPIGREEAAGRHLYWDYDDHFNARGAGFIGKVLFEWWARGLPATVRERPPVSN